MTNMTKLNKRLLMGLAVTLSLVVAITVVHAQEQQGGADSPERQAIQKAVVQTRVGGEVGWDFHFECP